MVDPEDPSPSWLHSLPHSIGIACIVCAHTMQVIHSIRDRYKVMNIEIDREDKGSSLFVFYQFECSLGVRIRIIIGQLIKYSYLWFLYWLPGKDIEGK